MQEEAHMPENSKQTLLVAHELADGSTAVSQLTTQGKLLKRFGTLPGAGAGLNEFRPHLAWAGGFLFRSNGVKLNTISEFNPDGTLKNTITPDTSAQHDIVPIARDFAGASIYMVDTFAATNVIRHLDDPHTGASSAFATLQYTGIAGISDLYLGRSNGSTALYALTQTSPETVPGGKSRVAKIDVDGTVRFFDNQRLNVPYMFDVGSVAVSVKGGTIYVATSTEIVEMDESGAELGSFPFVDTKPSMDVAPDGKLFAGHFDSTNGQVDVFNHAGKLLKSIHVPDATRVFDVLIAA